MFYNTNDNDNDDGSAVPSWLKDEDTASENAPLVAGQKSPSGASYVYGEGTPKRNSISETEIDYGGALTPSQPYAMKDDNMSDNPTWASDPNSLPIRSLKEDNYEDYSSSDMEELEDEDEEEEVSCPTEDIPNTENWEQQTKKKKKKKKKERLQKPTPGCVYAIFVVVRDLAVLANLVMIAAQVLPIVICDINIVQTVVRCYLAIFSFVFLLTEVDMIQSKLIQNWISRGFLYTFLGVVQIEQYTAMILNGSLDSEKSIRFHMLTWTVEWTSVFIHISSWWMIGTGCLYFVLGVFCLQSVTDSRRKEYQTRLKLYKQELNSPHDPFEG